MTDHSPDVASTGRRWTAQRVMMLGLVLVALLMARALSSADWDPTLLLAFGEEDPATLEYGEDRLGPVHRRDGLGHDGRLFFIQANDPLLLDPADNAAILDRPVYRSQRMLYPAVASLFGLLPARAIAWTLLAVNLAAYGWGTYAVARLAEHHSRSVLWGLAFALNLGVISEFFISGAGVLAAALVFVGIERASLGCHATAVAAFTGASLTREVMILAALGYGLWLLGHRRWRAAVTAASIPMLAVLGWALYIRLRLGWQDTDGIRELGLPFGGIVGSVEFWSSRFVNFAVGVVVAVVLLRFIWHVARHRTLIGLSTVGFAAIAFVLTVHVWFSYFDITRAVAPALTGYVLAVFVEQEPRSRSVAVPSSTPVDPL